MERQEIAAILAAGGLRPQHQFGQNFMVDVQALRAIVAAGDVKAGDIVLEVGPGVGNLTRLLSQAVRDGGAVLAVDIDRKLLPAAQGHHAVLTNVRWMLADVLAGKHAVEPAVLAALRELRKEHPRGELKLVSNLPYNAASPLVAELLVEMWKESRGTTHESERLIFSRLAFTVQWEVGQRMAAKAGTRDDGPLGILIQSMAKVEIVRKIAAGAFWPPPKIQSALVVVIPELEKIRRVRDAEGLQRFLTGIFSHRRQTLGNGLKHFMGEQWDADFKRVLAEKGFDLLRRAEDLALEELLRLERIVAELAKV